MKAVQYLVVCVFMATLFACRTERIDLPFEPIKEVDGNWRITRVSRNGTDITTRFDFSTFRINFTDSSYTISNPVPFLVNTNGTWRFDDPAYPFRISLTAKDSATKTSPLLYPVVGGKRNMVLTLSPGCNSNAYQYTLEKAE